MDLSTEMQFDLLNVQDDLSQFWIVFLPVRSNVLPSCPPQSHSVTLDVKSPGAAQQSRTLPIRQVFTPCVTHVRRQDVRMSRTTVTFTVSVPPEMMEVVEETLKREHRTRSELVREALRRYLTGKTVNTGVVESAR